MHEAIRAFNEELLRQDKSDATVRNYCNDVGLFIRWAEETYGAFDLSRVIRLYTTVETIAELRFSSGSDRDSNPRSRSSSSVWSLRATKFT